MTRHSVHAFIDGVKAADADVGFPTGSDCEDMHIEPTCAQLHAQGIACSTDMMSLENDNPVLTAPHGP